MPDVAVLDISDIRQLLINGPWKWNDLGSWINPGKDILFSDHIYYINKFSSKYFVNMNRWYWLSYHILFEITQKKIFPKMMWYNCIYQKRRIQKYCSFFIRLQRQRTRIVWRWKDCLQNLKDRNVRITDLTTERHVQVKSYMAKEETSIRHWFDVWHVAKGKSSTEMWRCVLLCYM